MKLAARTIGPGVRQAHASPLLRLRLPPGRAWLVKGLLYLAFFALIARALWVQVITTNFYQKQGDLRFVRTIELPAMRGRILDRHGNILASSIPVKTIWADPETLDADPAKVAELAKTLDLNAAELERRLRLDKQFVYVKRQVDIDTARKVQALGIKGIYFSPSYRRYYPEGAAAGQLVGITDIENQGQSGLELTFQRELAGHPGTRKVMRDRLGNVIEDVGGGIPPINGEDVQLSIDSKIQYLTYQALKQAVVDNKAKNGSAVVLDATNGQVLAMANYPSFDPNHRRRADQADMRNYALTDTYEPGSVMKPITIAAALQAGIVTPQTVFHTAPGCLNVYGNNICDDSDNGTIALPQVIQYSSNVATSKIVMRMSARQQWDMYTAVGLGQRPHVAFPGAASGILRPWEKWRPIDAVTQGFGYGISVSTFQLAHAYLIFANHGEIIPATLFKSDAPVRGVQVVSPKVAREMRSMLALVTQSGGTAPAAAVPGYSTGGKTGTAYIWKGNSYDKHLFRAQFVGMAPIGKPRIVMAISVDQPSAGKHFGGDVSAPVFAQVVPQALRILGVPPDLPVKPDVAPALSAQARPAPRAEQNGAGA
ncbi:MAG: penicillin-binding protein 2 [Betaproteobacteria bacterium]|uniref:Peptidoglycan D,D-transpeptidase FtsI n=1 Tax=Thiomonas delicata TaxID=364030 RepID=A0A238D377_THIDL|nr:penicillin-binding protein 2 [Thiomonas delicata]MDE2130032.1 penicillin-binding protein 2 [Betaproteobacteria bacterium]OZB55310.1 MAG: cell division protein [Thiomonas sp. 14-66-4]OZB61375.1 MAG: cell division protein [Thiomonas sp. 13-66-29]SBP87737.1 Peptidoglycan glycosyltransferase [Thiomonas delicata]